MPAAARPNDALPPDRLLTIGEVARRSGLTASALRFYDREGVLVPADVDPFTGYRRYAVGQVRAARLLASLRRVGMPLAEVALVLDEDARGASGAAADVVQAHEQRLVDGLADAREEIRRTLDLLGDPHLGPHLADPRTCRVVVGAVELGAALASVRFAVAPGEPVAGAPDGPDLRVLTGILLEVCGAEVRCVASDRYRLAVGWAPVVGEPSASPEEPMGVVVPLEWADRVAEACAGAEAGAEVVLHVRREHAGALVDGELVATPALPGTFPDYRSIVDTGSARRPVDASRLSGHLPVERQAVGLVVRDGAVLVAPADGDAHVHVDPEFLHEALAVAGERPTLVLDGPHRPLAIRGESAGFSVLMPVAPDAGHP